MNCNGAKDKISSYLDSEIDKQEIAHFEQHISSCTACHNEIDQIKKAMALLKQCKDELMNSSYLKACLIFLVTIL